METKQDELIKQLEKLSGTWVGEGIAEYPTTDTFHYRETITFIRSEGKPYLYYNQRTWRKDQSGKEVPSHWETGFWRILPNNEVELLCAQSGGRVEVARGRLEPTEDGFTLRFNSSLLANDTRVEQTYREYNFQTGNLKYSLQMQTTAVPNLTMHVRALLARSK